MRYDLPITVRTINGITRHRLSAIAPRKIGARRFASQIFQPPAACMASLVVAQNGMNLQRPHAMLAETGIARGARLRPSTTV